MKLGLWDMYLNRIFNHDIFQGFIIKECNMQLIATLNLEISLTDNVLLTEQNYIISW